MCVPVVGDQGEFEQLIFFIAMNEKPQIVSKMSNHIHCSILQDR